MQEKQALSPDAEEDRKSRTMDEMRKEAEWLRGKM
jgi:hypothetical protein